jgi:phage baseplate assembly protein W
MMGMDEQTGAALTDAHAWTRQAIGRAIRTPRGSVPMRPDFGSDVYKLVDRNMTAATRLAIVAAVADAVDRHVSTVRIRSVVAAASETGRLVLDITYTWRPDGRTYREGLTV